MAKHVNMELIKKGLKKCNVCLEVKSVAAFSKNRVHTHGLQRECKACRVRLERERRQRNPLSHRDEVKRWKQRNPEMVSKQLERWRNNNPDKIRAHKLARNISLGPECEDCGSTERLERHHPDYDKPLEIMTLCKPCHTKT